jgi:hypothetical protein
MPVSSSFGRRYWTGDLQPTSCRWLSAVSTPTARSKFGRSPGRIPPKEARQRGVVCSCYIIPLRQSETLSAALTSHRFTRSPTSRLIERCQLARPADNAGRSERTLDIWPGSFHLLFSTRLSHKRLSSPTIRSHRFRDSVVDRRLLISHPENTPIIPSRKSQQTL